MPTGDVKREWVRRQHATGCLMDSTSCGRLIAGVSWTQSGFAAAELLGAGSRRMAGSSRHMNHPTARGGSDEREGGEVAWMRVTMRVAIWRFEVGFDFVPRLATASTHVPPHRTGTRSIFHSLIGSLLPQFHLLQALVQGHGVPFACIASRNIVVKTDHELIFTNCLNTLHIPGLSIPRSHETQDWFSSDICNSTSNDLSVTHRADRGWSFRSKISSHLRSLFSQAPP